MARNLSTPVYDQGILKLDKVTGIRHDKGQKMTYVPVKNPYKNDPPAAMKTVANVTKDGKKKS
jgi:hypothetical protein